MDSNDLAIVLVTDETGLISKIKILKVYKWLSETYCHTSKNRAPFNM